MLRYNSEWILDLNMESRLKLLANFTVARILERDDFHNRYTSGQSISLHEFLYPVMQAYDSVVIKADVELGGTDQLFNLLAGRELMEKMGMEPQVCLTLPLLEGTDGVKKMSKSYGNYIGLTDEAADMFGKVMSRNIGAAYYDDVAAEAAEADFDLKFKEHGFPADAPIFAPDLTPDENGLVYVAKILVDAGVAGTASEARRLIDGGGVKVNGEALAPKAYNVAPEVLAGAEVQVGKKKFVRFE